MAQDDREDSVIDISTQSSPVEESGTGCPHTLSIPRTLVRHSQPPPYRSRQGSAATTNGHATITSYPYTPSPLAHTDTPPTGLMRRPSQTGVGVLFHRPFELRLHVPPTDVSLSPLEAPFTMGSAESLPDSIHDPRSPLDLSLEAAGLWLEYEQDIVDHSRGHERYSPSVVAPYPSH